MTELKKTITIELDLFEHSMIENLAAEFNTTPHNLLIAGLKDAAIELGLDWEEMRLDYFKQ